MTDAPIKQLINHIILSMITIIQEQLHCNNYIHLLNAIFQHLLQHMLSVFNRMFHFVRITHVFQNAGYMCVCAMDKT